MEVYGKTFLSFKLRHLSHETTLAARSKSKGTAEFVLRQSKPFKKCLQSGYCKSFSDLCENICRFPLFRFYHELLSAKVLVPFKGIIEGEKEAAKHDFTNFVAPSGINSIVKHFLHSSGEACPYFLLLG